MKWLMKLFQKTFKQLVLELVDEILEQALYNIFRESIWKNKENNAEFGVPAGLERAIAEDIALRLRGMIEERLNRG